MINIKNKKLKFALLSLASIALAVGVITISNLTIKGYVTVRNFIKNPLGDYLDFTEVDIPDAKAEAIYKADMTVREKILFFADMYGVDKKDALRIAECESRLDPEAENINGSATGVYQFIRKTWKNYCGGDVKNADHNIICFMQKYKDNPEWWECK